MGNKKFYSWTILLRANITMTNNLSDILEEYFCPRGTEKLAQGYNEEGPMQVSIWYPAKLKAGIRSDVRLEKRNDGMKRITFYPGENDGLSMDVEDIVKQVAKWVGACEGGTQEILEELRGKDSNDEEEDE